MCVCKDVKMTIKKKKSRLSSLSFFALVSLQLLNFAKQDLCHDARWNIKFSVVSSHPNLTINGRASMFLNSSTFFRNVVYASNLPTAVCTPFVFCRLDYWLISDKLHDLVSKVRHHTFDKDRSFCHIFGNRRDTSMR